VTLMGVEAMDLGKRFGATTALSEVSLEAQAGVLGLLGPNGAGKTTLTRILATVLSPDRGRLRLAGLDPSVDEQRVAIRRRLGYLPQDPGFHRRFTAWEYLDYVAILKEHTERRGRRLEVQRVLEEVELTEVARTRIHALSGGMRRRLGLAQALLGDPDLLVLDEPAAGVDPEQRLLLRELLSRLGERRTVIVATHHTEDVMALCKRVVVLAEGRVLFSGTPSALADVAKGRVWGSETRDPAALVSWRGGDGLHRNVGTPPAGAALLAPTLEDGYLLLRRQVTPVAHSAAR